MPHTSKVLSRLTIEELWERWWTTECPAAYVRLVEHYQPLLDIVVNSVHRLGSVWTERNDLKSAGQFGLMKAINQFLPEQQVPFEAFAAQLIKWAILDGQRAIDHLSHRFRTKFNAAKGAGATLEQQLGRSPTKIEIADYLGVKKETVLELYETVKSARLRVLNQNVATESSHHDNHDNHLEEKYVRQETQKTIRETINQLPAREQFVIKAYYYDELTFAEIGEQLGITESAAHRIHTKACRMMKPDLESI